MSDVADDGRPASHHVEWQSRRNNEIPIIRYHFFRRSTRPNGSNLKNVTRKPPAGILDMKINISTTIQHGTIKTQ